MISILCKKKKKKKKKKNKNNNKVQFVSYIFIINVLFIK